MSVSLPQLHWRILPAASCWHTVRSLLRVPTREGPIAEALAPAVAELRTTFAEERMPGEVFLDHLLPLSVTLDSSQRCLEVALTRTIGHGEGTFRLRRLSALLAKVRNNYDRVLSHHPLYLTGALHELRRRWALHGPGVLAAVRNWTDSDVLVEEANVVVVYPALGGAGSAHLTYNLACIEGVAADPVPDLPEVLRLAWLVSTLNLDLPRYSDHLTRDRLSAVAHLAMVPAVLIAAESLDLVACDEPTLRQAVAAWLGPQERLEEQAELVVQWWDVYRTMRPCWPTALEALDRMRPAA